jgi:predicted ABC-type transport system involved in lysophospholipase L1 biosynthesis ATPase subunit
MPLCSPISGLGLEEPLDLLVAELGPEVAALHRVVGRTGLARAPLEAMGREQRGTHRAARITGGRLDPQAPERTLSQDPAVAHAVERHPAGQAEVLAARLAVELIQMHLREAFETADINALVRHVKQPLRDPA